MTIQYTVTINGVRVQSESGLQDVVKEVDINYTGTVDSCTFTLPFTVKLPAPDADGFTAFMDLTEGQLVAWVEAQEDMLQPRKDHIAIVLEREVEKAALANKPLPWTPPPTPVDAGMPLADPEE